MYNECTSERFFAKIEVSFRGVEIQKIGLQDDEHSERTEEEENVEENGEDEDEEEAFWYIDSVTGEIDVNFNKKHLKI